MADARTTLSVIGPHCGCGKTLFVTRLLRDIKRLACLKISPAHDWPAGGSPGDATTARDYYLHDPAELDRPGKDTAVYLEAGAAHVERLRHRRNGLAAGLGATLDRFPPAVPIVVESSSAVELLEPVAVVLVVRPPMREMKPSTLNILSLVTDLFVNAADRDRLATIEAERLRDEFRTLRPLHVWSADLIREPLPKDLLIQLRTLLRK